MRQLAARFGTARVKHWSGVQRLHHRLGQIVKDRRYLEDNVSCSRLSGLKRAVNHKAGGGFGGPGNDSCEGQARFVES